MKKSAFVIMIVVATFGLTAFGCMNWNNPPTVEAAIDNSETEVLSEDIIGAIYDPAPNNDFFYDVDTRFILNVTKEQLSKAESLSDLLPEEMIKPKGSYRSVEVILLDDSRQTEIRESGSGEILNAAQIKLLRSLDYSTNILIKAEYVQKNELTGDRKKLYYSTYNDCS